MRGVLVLLAALAGCDQVFDLSGREPADAAPMIDAPPTPDAPIPTCGSRTTLIDDTFDGTAECVPWGNPFENPGTTLEQSEGDLQIRPRQSGQAAGCTSINTYMPPQGGLIAEVTATLDAPGSYTSMTFGQADSIQVIDGELVHSHSNSSMRYGMTPYVPTTMRWWRLNVENGMIVASHSVDGVNNWVPFSQRMASSSNSRGTIALLAGLSTDVPSVGIVARFGRLLLCE